MTELDKMGLEAATVAVHFAADDEDGTLAEAAVAAYLEAVATTSAGVTEEQRELLLRASYMVGNPSAWSSYDERGSEMIRELAAALEASLHSRGVTAEQCKDALQEAIAHPSYALGYNEGFARGQDDAALASRVAPVSQKEAVIVATMHRSDTETLFSKGHVPNMLGFTSSPLYASPIAAPAGEPGIKALEWPEPKVVNPDIANPTGIPYIDCLLDRLLGAQRDINFEANTHMSQSLCDAAALLDEVETCIRKQAIRTALHPSPTPVSAPVGDWTPTHRHVKRGTEYEHIGTARLQTDEPLGDMAYVEVYLGRGGDLWVRNHSEFYDGRFEALPSSPAGDANG